jgi:hypothetical protein
VAQPSCWGLWNSSLIGVAIKPAKAGNKTTIIVFITVKSLITTLKDVK